MPHNARLIEIDAVKMLSMQRDLQLCLHWLVFVFSSQ